MFFIYNRFWRFTEEGEKDDLQHYWIHNDWYIQMKSLTVYYLINNKIVP